MNTYEYLQMLQMQNQNPQGLPKSAPPVVQSQPSLPRAMPPGVPHGTYQPMHAPQSPINTGSREAIESIRQSLGHRTSDFEKSMGRLASNVGRGLYAKSGSEFGKAMAQIPYDPYEEEEQRIKENMEILAYLQRAQEANKEQEYRRLKMAQDYNLQNRHLTESERHNRATEGKPTSSGYDILNTKEAKAVESQIKAETGDHVEAIGAMKPQMKLYANKSIDDYISRANAAADGLQTVSRMKSLAEANPQLLNSWQFIVTNRYMDKPTLLNQIALLPLSEEEKDTLFEMASLAKNLNVDSIKGIPSKGLNQNLERMLFSANPNSRMSLGAFNNILDKTQEGFEYGYREYGKAAKYGREGLLYKPSIREAKEHAPTAEEHKAMADAETPSIKNLSDKDFEELYSTVK